jgi:hypothetical protein
MFDYRVCAMIALSMVIAAPALVYADLEHSRQFDYAFSRSGEYQLASAGGSAGDARGDAGMAIARRWQAEPLNRSDFPVRGHAQFARIDNPTIATGAIATGERPESR